MCFRFFLSACLYESVFGYMTVAAAIYAVGWARFPAYRKFNDYFMFVSSLFHSPSPHSLSLAQHWKTECHFVRWCSLCVLTAQQIEATLYSHWMWRRKKTLMINLFVCLVGCLLARFGITSRARIRIVAFSLFEFSCPYVDEWKKNKEHQTQANTHNHTFIYCYCYYYCYYYIVERKREK